MLATVRPLAWTGQAGCSSWMKLGKTISVPGGPRRRTTTDPFAEFKKQARVGWAKYAPLAVFTKTPAAHLARVAGVRAGQNVLDVACGTGSVALTARRIGARATGLDLTPELLALAKESASLAGLDDVTWKPRHQAKRPT
jgi:2-polyprenyl-3-methyl-5-hydroxy-6-metoxy-1,4-benzoquinol methylase